MTLVILAGGMGSRFGGLKQIEPIGPNGEFIIDYSIYDAIKAGFKKVVFIIKEENFDIFKETIGKRIEGKIAVEYVFQNMQNIPKEIKIPENRVKPLGTAHAIFCCKDVIKGDFAVISADDFYGFESFKLLKENEKNSDYCAIGYKLGNCIDANGSVKRGICFSDDNNYLKNIIECKVEREKYFIKAQSLEDNKIFKLDDNHPVSMLMFGLKNSIFEYLEKDFKRFIIENKDNLENCEYLLPTVLGNMMDENLIKIKLIPTPSIWKGITYKEDKQELVNYIKKEIEKGVYPDNLYK